MKIKRLFAIGIPENKHDIMEYGSRSRFFHDWSKQNGTTVKYFEPTVEQRSNKEVFKKTLINSLSDFNPDLIFIYDNNPCKLFDVLIEHKKNAKVAFWHCDWTPLRDRWNSYYKKNSVVDYLFVTSAGHVDMYKNDLDIIVSYLPNEFANDYDSPIFDQNFCSDVVFVGQCAPCIAERFYDNRKKFIQYLLSEKCPLKIFPDMNDVSQQDYNIIYNKRLWENQKHNLSKMYGSGKIFLGIHTKEVDETFCYFSNRPFITMGYGAFYLCWNSNGIEKIFKPGVHLDVFSSFEEGLDKINFYLKNEEERKIISQNARKLIFEKHLSKHRCLDMFETIENEKPTFSGWL